MNHEESRIQSEIVKWLAHVGIFCHLVGNDAVGADARRQATMITIGLKPGVADLIVWIPIEQSGCPPLVRIAYIEVKTPSGRQSPRQVDFEARCRSCGIAYHVVRSLDDMQKILLTYAT